MSWIRRLWWTPRPRRPDRRAWPYQPRLEGLEDRRLPALFQPLLTALTGGSLPFGVATGDVNGDGSVDLVTANASSGNVGVLLGVGDGTFAAPATVAAGLNPYAVALGDFNGDSNLDMAVANNASNTISLLLGNGNGTFAPAPGAPSAISGGPRALVVGHFDNDHILDLAVGAERGGVSVLLGNGDGTFKLPTVVSNALGSALVAGHFNQDDRIDLAVASDWNPGSVTVLLGTGTGNFVTATGSPVPLGATRATGIEARDLNGDGKTDLVVANFTDNKVSVLLGNGDGTFTARSAAPVPGGPFAVALADFNGDGQLDLATANATSGDLSVLLGTEEGSFQAPATFAIFNPAPPSPPQPPLAVAAADFNGDNKPDLAAPNTGSLLAPGDSVTTLLSTLGAGPVAVTATEGAALANVAVATVTNADPSVTADRLAATITWGNGQVTVGTILANAAGGFDVKGSAVYLDPGTFPIQVEVVNPVDDNRVTVSTRATVADAPITAFAVAQIPAAGSRVEGAVAVFADAGGPEAESNYTATIDWGDAASSPGTVLAANALLLVKGSHTYGLVGKYPITVTITEQAGGTTTVETSALIGTPAERFVAQTYVDLLHRPVDAGGLAYWTYFLSQGHSRSEMVRMLTTTPEYRALVVQGLYSRYLHRDADYGGLTYFISMLEAGGTMEQVATTLVGSLEYYQVQGGSTDDGFLAALYLDGLGRAIDADGRAYFGSALNNETLSPAQVADLLFSSSEYRSKVVQANFQKFLLHAADAEGVDYFLGKLHQGSRAEDVLAEILGSDEYFLRM